MVPVFMVCEKNYEMRGMYNLLKEGTVQSEPQNNKPNVVVENRPA